MAAPPPPRIMLDDDSVPATVRRAPEPYRKQTSPSFPRVEARRLPGSVPPPPMRGVETPPLGVPSLVELETRSQRARTLSRLVDELPGRWVAGRYRVEGFIGRGATSVVFSAIDTRADEDAETDEIALKVLDPALASNARALVRFRREASAAMAVDGPNVVRVLQADACAATHALVADDGARMGVPFIAMELLVGTDLKTFVDERGPLDAHDAVTIVRGVASGLDLAHGAGVVHRDLKPANLFLASRASTFGGVSSSTIKVLDFGVASLVDAESTSPAGFFGTPWFMAPEQVAGGAIGPAADRWALGLIAFRVLTAQSYWSATALADLLTDIVAGPTVTPSEAVRSREIQTRAVVGPEFDAWFARACHVDPASRFECARAQADALERALASDAAG